MPDTAAALTARVRPVRGSRMPSFAAAPGGPAANAGQRVSVGFVVDTTGRPDSCSIRVVAETRRGLGDWLKAQVALMRFEPGRIRDHAVRVMTSLMLESGPMTTRVVR